MRCRGLRYLTILLPAVLCLALATPAVVFGQVAQAAAGVAVDAEGVLRTKTIAEVGGPLTRDRIAAARASLNPKLATFSKLRYISLKHLEKALAAHQGVPTEEMRNLAGLLRLRYVFLYPDSKDIVIAGPAEGWVADGIGRVVGLSSGRAVIQLQDLVVALRAFPPGGNPTKNIGCSIDPTKEGLAAKDRFLKSIPSTFYGPPNNQLAENIANGLRTSLGMQAVTVSGVAPSTHFAQVMVEADYRMKLIGIGLEKPPIRLVSYVERADTATINRNAMKRWYFIPDYECVRTGDEGMAMELVGDGVKLVGEDEMVSAEGNRRAVGRSDRASQGFVKAFTQHYSQLAERSPVYAELRNLIDLAVGAAYMQQENFYGKAEWKMELLGDEKRFSVETYNVPKQVGTAVNIVWKGPAKFSTPLGGGVVIDARRALDPQKRLTDEEGKVAKIRQQAKIQLPKGQWWWD